MSRTIKTMTVWIAACVALFAQAQKTWKSQAEYDLYSEAAKETDGRKKIAALDKWKQQFPETDFKQQRLTSYVDAYRQLNDIPNVVASLNELLSLDPKDLQVMSAILIFTLPPYNQTTPAALENAVKVANAALGGLDNKPANVTDADWPKTRRGTGALAHTALGWVAMTRNDAPAAEREYLKALESDPNAAQVDAWLGNMLRAQKTPEKVSQALFFYARAAAYDGTGALPPALRQQFDDYLQKVYKAHHGADAAGLQELKQLAKSQPLPPEGFRIKTEAEIETEKAAEFQKANPSLALWTNLKRELTSPNGAQYFEANMKGADVPGGAGGVSAFKGTILAAKPALHPKELVVAIADPKVAEVTLKLDTALTGKPEPGSEIEFGGMPDTFTAEPFMVTFQVERAKIKGLKMQAPPATARKAPPRKKK